MVEQIVSWILDINIGIFFIVTLIMVFSQFADGFIKSLKKKGGADQDSEMLDTMNTYIKILKELIEKQLTIMKLIWTFNISSIVLIFLYSSICFTATITTITFSFSRFTGLYLPFLKTVILLMSIEYSVLSLFNLCRIDIFKLLKASRVDPSWDNILSFIVLNEVKVKRVDDAFDEVRDFKIK